MATQTSELANEEEAKPRFSEIRMQLILLGQSRSVCFLKHGKDN